MTLKQLLDWFKEKHELTLTMLSYGPSMIYGFIRQKDKLQERLATPIVHLVESISGKQLSPQQVYIVLECLAEDRDGEDVDVPYIRFRVY